MIWMYITNDVRLAKVAHAAGVQRIFVDWEVLGKKDRQGHLDTVQSDHTVEDAHRIRRSVPSAELMVRLNPLHSDTPDEVEAAISAGTDLVMLPMFRNSLEVIELAKMVDNRVGIVPLFETPESLDHVEEIARIASVPEIYVGLNDLHLALGMRFMFEPLADGMLEHLPAVTKSAGVRFGIGGIARAGEGLVSGEMVLGEHVRLGSHSVILSRTFFRPQEDSLEDPGVVFEMELLKLVEAEQYLLQRSPIDVERDCSKFRQMVDQVARSANNG